MKKWLQPDVHFASLYDLTPAFLQERGLRLLILDIDNTLVMHGGPPDERAIAFIKSMQDANLHVALLSNNSKARLDLFNRELGVFAVYKGQKPRRKGFLKIMRHFGCQSSETAVAGDQLFTDILGGKRTGLFTILVDPIHPSETWFIRLKRKFETLFYQR
jgi:HAD superfamily phosphatase (TIGR01668 family)